MYPAPHPRAGTVFRERTVRRGRLQNSLVALALLALLGLAVLLMPSQQTFNDAFARTITRRASQGTPESFPLRINEVMSSNKRAFPDDRGNYSDWVELENLSNTPINLEGIGLSDREHEIRFIFPKMELPAHGVVIVICDKTYTAVTDTMPHARFKISAGGDSVYLFDRSGILLDQVNIPPLKPDTSYAFVAGEWTVTDRYTPGFPNTDEGRDAFHAQIYAPHADLVISEVCASNESIIADEDGEFPGWIELYNGGPLPIDLHHYLLTNNPVKLGKWRFPEGAVIEPGGFYLVFTSGKDKPGTDGMSAHANFTLSRNGTTIVLTDTLSQPVDRVQYDRTDKDTSIRRVEGLQDTWEVSRQPTPGLPNTPEGEAEMDERIRARNRSGLFVSEVMASSLGVDTPYGNTSYDWVEIVNTGGEPVNLRGYGLSNTPNRPRKWQFPSYTIQPGEYLLVFCSGLGESPTRSGALHSNFRLSAGGQAVTLSDPSGNVLDRLVVPRLDTGTSYGRGANLQGFYYYDEPTPGDENHTRGLPGYAPQPVISLRGGLYIQPVTVELEAPDGVRIRYTLDGSKPEENVGRDYEGPITITKAQVLRARGFKEGFRPSEVATESFLINVYHILPVVSLTIDPDDLWNPLTGIYADGLDETFERIPFRQATYYRMNKDRAQRERVGNFEYMSPSGEQLLNAVTAVQLHGNFSLDIAQKSFRITAKPKYGVDALRYPFFENRPYDQYRSVILRNGGNDGSYSRIIDSLIHEIVDWTDADLIHQAYQPVIVYLNGQYWGQYDIRERVNKYYAAMYEGWDSPRNIDYIKGDNNVLNGSFSDYRALLEYVRKHDLNNPEALSRVLDWIDVDNYFDFMIFETYFGNTDTMNIKFYRERRDGAKWRWVFFDLDWGYFTRTTNGFNAWLKESGTGDKHGDNTLIRALLKVPEMRDKFLRRYGELFRETFTDTDRIIAQIDRMVSAIEPEMNRHFTRWAGETSPVVAIDPYNARDNAYAYWMGRVNRLKNTVSARPHHVWLQAKDWFKLSDAEMLDYFGPCPEEGENRF